MLTVVGGQSPEEIKRREVELDSECRTCNLLQLLLNSRTTDIVFVTLLRTAVETVIAKCTSCCTMPKSPLPHHSCCSGGGPRPPRSAEDRIVGMSHSLFIPPPPPHLPFSPSLISHLASVDEKQHVYLCCRRCDWLQEQLTPHHLPFTCPTILC